MLPNLQLDHVQSGSSGLAIAACKGGSNSSLSWLHLALLAYLHKEFWEWRIVQLLSLKGLAILIPAFRPANQPFGITSWARGLLPEL